MASASQNWVIKAQYPKYPKVKQSTPPNSFTTTRTLWILILFRTHESTLKVITESPFLFNLKMQPWSDELTFRRLIGQQRKSLTSFKSPLNSKVHQHRKLLISRSSLLLHDDKESWGWNYAERRKIWLLWEKVICGQLKRQWRRKMLCLLTLQDSKHKYSNFKCLNLRKFQISLQPEWNFSEQDDSREFRVINIALV